MQHQHQRKGGDACGQLTIVCALTVAPMLEKRVTGTGLRREGLRAGA